MTSHEGTVFRFPGWICDLITGNLERGYASMKSHATPKMALIVAAVGLGLLAGCSTTSSKPKLSSEQVMEEGFEGKGSIAARLSQDKGTQADKMRMAYLTEQLALNKPVKGDLASWNQKTTALHEAAVELANNAPGALVNWKAAVDCKKCHSVHKPD